MSNVAVNLVQGRAYDALQQLLGLGLKQKDVAYRLSVSPTLISHVNGIHQHPDFHVTAKVACRLEELAKTVRLEGAADVLGRWPLNVLETCNTSGPVDDEVRSDIRDAIVTGLSRLSATDGAPTFILPEGIAGALAALGRDAWIFVRASRDEINTGEVRQNIDLVRSEIGRLHVQIHELEHVIDQLQQDLPPSELAPRIPAAAY
jgi:hypothetical protein